MIRQRELEKFLVDARIDEKKLPTPFVQDILRLTRDGVAPEVGMQATDSSASQAVGNAKRIESGFKFGGKSKAELIGVLPIMVEVAQLALRLSTQDFMIFDGLRTPEEQKVLVAKGASKTLNSKHLKQKDGFSHAFDAVPVVGSIPKWDWELIYPVAYAVDQAATALGVADKIRWGGAWDRTLADFGGDPKAYEKEVKDYVDRHPGKDFIDGPHFEWIQ